MCSKNVLFNFSTFQFIKKFFVLCTHHIFTVTLARVETLTAKYSSQIKATLNTDMKETGRERKKQEDVRGHAPKHTGHHSSYTHRLIHTIQPFRAHITGSFQMHGVWVYEAHIETKS